MGLIMSILDAAGRAIAKPNADEAEVDVLSEGDDSDEALVNWTEGGKKKSATGKVAKSTLAQMTLQTVSIPQNFAGLESVSTPTRLRYQIFTIVSVDEQDDYVEVVANHIFYEQATNYTVWTPETLVNYSCGAICRNVMANTINGDEGFKVATDCTEQLPWHQIDYARKNLIEVFLDPENGICRRFNLNLVRDNMNFYVLKNVGYDRGFVIEDKKNLLGVQRQENIENTVTRIAAYGKDKNGNILWLNNNGEKYVDSQYISNYKHPRVEIYDTGVQITGDKEAEQLHAQGRDSEIVTAENINAKIYNAAVKRFTEDHVDDPEVTMKVDFVSLGDTEEYKQYRDLDKVYLYDIVHVKHSGRDYSYGAQVIGVEHDILTGMLLSVTIGNIVSWDGIRKVANWQVPEIDGSIIRMHSITASQYDYGSVTGSAIRDEAISGNHINVPSVSQALNVDQLKSILAQAGLVLDDDGILIYQTSDDNMLKAMLNVQADRISAEVTRATGAESNISGQLVVEAGKVAMVVGTNSGGNFIKAAEIATAINDAGEGIATINAAKVNISATSTLHTLAGAIEEDDQGNLVIKSAGGMRVRRTEQGVTSEFGVFDNGNLTAGVMIKKINGTNTETHITGNKIYVGNGASANEQLSTWAADTDGLFATNISALQGRISSLEVDKLSTNQLSSEISNLASVRVNIIAGSTASFTTGSFGDIGTDTLTVPNGGLTLGSTALSTTNLVKSVEGSPVTGGGYKLTVTQVNGYSHDITFNTASSITFSGAWTGASYTATAKDPDDNVLGSVSTSISKRWSGSSLLIESGTDSLLSESLGYSTVAYAPSDVTATINTFSNSHMAGVFVTAQSAGGGNGRIYTFKVDASGEYTAGRTAGAASVTLTKGSWSGGSITVTASNGEEETISFPAVTMDQGSFAGHKKWVYAYSNEAGISGYVQRLEVDATSEYTAGQTNGRAGVTLSAAGWSGGSNVVSASNGESVTVTFPAVTMGQDSSFSSHKKWVYAYSNAAGITGYVQRLEVDASSEYEAGVQAGSSDYQTAFDAGWSAYWNSNQWGNSNVGNLTYINRPGSTPTSGSVTWFTIMATAAVTFNSTSKKFVATGVARSGGGTTFQTATAESDVIKTVTSQAYNSSTHAYTATGTAYNGTTALVSSTSTTGTEAYTAGYNKGWDDAVAKMSRSGADIYGPSPSSRGSALKWYEITVVQGSPVITGGSTSGINMSASCTAYVNRVAVATDTKTNTMPSPI